METGYDKIYELMDRLEDAFLIIGGDFIACVIASQDYINRNKSLNEEKLTDFYKGLTMIHVRLLMLIENNFRLTPSQYLYTFFRQSKHMNE